MLLDIISTILSSGIFQEPLTMIKPGNTSRKYDTHITLRTFITGLIPLCNVVRECVLDSYRGSIKYGYYMCKCISISYRITNENTCLGTSIMIVPIAVSIGYLISNRDELDIMNITSTATLLLKKYSTVQDTVMLYKAVRMVQPSYTKKLNIVPALPDLYSESYEHDIIKSDLTLWKLFKYCAHIDICARQVVTHYEDVLELLRYFKDVLGVCRDYDLTILKTYLYSISKFGDSLILRKFGYETLNYVRRRAQEILKSLENKHVLHIDNVEKFHNELVSRGINPGSAADLIAIVLTLYNLERFLTW